MPEIRNESYVCFVHGHGAQYSSNPQPGRDTANRQRPLSLRALEIARERAKAQLAFQRIAGKQPEKK